MRTQLRHQLRKIAPGFLKRGPKGQGMLFAIGYVLDGLADWAIQGLWARFPEKAPESALGALGRDRRIVRGFDESADAYRTRLLRWLPDWRKAGHAYAVLEQVAGYLTPHAVKLRIVTNSGVWYTREADGTLSWQVERNWDWDGDTAKWSRFWLIIYPPGSLWSEGRPLGDVELWGGALGTAGFTLGTTATPEQVKTIRQIVRTWKPAHARCDWIVIAFDEDTFDPAAPEPDGTWGPWGEVGTSPREPVREGSARYWNGTVEVPLNA